MTESTEKAVTPRPRNAGSVIPELPIYQQLQRIGGNLTPERVSAIIRQADMGSMAQLMDLANEARQKDCHLQSVLETRENAVAALPWDLALPEDASRKEKKAAALAKDILKYVLPKLVPHQNGAVYYGYGVTEQTWRKVSGYLVVDETLPVAPRRFSFVSGKLRWWDSGGEHPQPGVDLREYPGQFVISQPRINGDVANREGLVRPLMWAALFRNWAIADWMKLAEIAWKPWRTGTYEKNASQEDIDHLVATLMAMTSNGIAAVPETVKLNVQWPGQSGTATQGTHAVLCAVLASEMSKAVLGQTETTESSKSSGYAQAKVHNEVRKDRREGDARFIAADVTRDFIRWVTYWNFGPDVRPSSLFFVTEDGVDFAAFSESVKTLKEAGLRLSAKWARATLGTPDPKVGEELVGDLEKKAESDGSEEKPQGDDTGNPGGAGEDSGDGADA